MKLVSQTPQHKYVRLLQVVLIVSIASGLAFYVSAACANMIILGDQSRILTKLVSYHNSGHPSLWEFLWAEHGGQRVVFYHLISLLNFKFFDSNTLLEAGLSVVIVTCTLALLLSGLNRRLENSGQNSWGSQVFGSVCLSIICLSWICSNMFTWTIGVGLFAINLFIIATLNLYDRLLFSRRLAPGVAVACSTAWPLIALVVMAGFVYILLASLCAILAVVFFKQKSKRAFLVLICTLLASITALLIYRSESAASVLSSTPPSLSESVLFGLKVLGNSLLLNAQVPGLYSWAGGVLVIVFAVVLLQSLFDRESDYDLLSNGLIICSLLFAGVITISRSYLGSDAGLAPRYIPSSQIGLIGLVLHISGSRMPKKYLGKIVSFAIPLAITVILAFGVTREFRAAPFKRNSLLALRDVAAKTLFDAAALSDQELKRVTYKGDSPEEFVRVAHMLVRNGLSGFGKANGFGDKIYLKGSWNNVKPKTLSLCGQGVVSFCSTTRPVLLAESSEARSIVVSSYSHNASRTFVIEPGKTCEIWPWEDVSSPSGSSANINGWQKVIIDLVGVHNPHPKQQTILITVVDHRPVVTLE